MPSIPTLHTPRLILQEVTAADIPAYERHFIDYAVIRNLSAVVPWPYPPDGVSQFLTSTVFPRQGIDRWMWGIFERETPYELIGAIDLWREERPEQRGFWLGRNYWGRGYMTEAATAVNDFAFTSLGFERLIFENACGNARSRRVKEKTGARLIQVCPAQFVDPTLTEQELWELTREAWESWQNGEQDKVYEK